MDAISLPVVVRKCRRAHVIFYVARAENAARIDVFKAGNNFMRRLGMPRGPSRSGGRGWLMAMTDSTAPCSPAVSRMESRSGISAVTPSRENRLVPR